MDVYTTKRCRSTSQTNSFLLQHHGGVDRHYFVDLEASKATHDDGACSESSERHIVESEHVCPAFSATVDMQAEAEGDESDVAVSDLEDSSDEPSEEGQDNSAEAVAVRRAFLASVHSSAPHVAGSQDDEVTWTGDQILSWITEAMDLAVAADDRRKRVKNLWLDWSRLDHFLPQSHRQQIVRRLDQKLMENDYPGLRSMMSEMAEISLCEQAEATADQEAHSIIDAAAQAHTPFRLANVSARGMAGGSAKDARPRGRSRSHSCKSSRHVPSEQEKKKRRDKKKK